MEPIGNIPLHFRSFLTPSEKISSSNKNPPSASSQALPLKPKGKSPIRSSSQLVPSEDGSTTQDIPSRVLKSAIPQGKAPAWLAAPIHSPAPFINKEKKNSPWTGTIHSFNRFSQVSGIT